MENIFFDEDHAMSLVLDEIFREEDEEIQRPLEQEVHQPNPRSS